MNISQAQTYLQKYFGYSTFRNGQQQIVESVLAGLDTFGILPTGGGKSICYQIPALLLDGITVVVSPLISLMKDQVDSLKQTGIPATYINSSLTATELRERISEIHNHAYKIIYVAPERLETEYFLSLFRQLPVALLAIDEAHCISTWGHDFRPSYQLIPRAIHTLSKKPIILALTATATKQVQDDILHLLHIPVENTYRTTFRRENLHFTVQKNVNKKDFIIQYLRTHPNQSGIIYAGTRKDVDMLHQFLHKQKYKVGKYHAGMSEEERNTAQEAFSYDRTPIIVATNAFGMGIDKSDVRFVIHYNLPKNLEAYYQEAGRAGRDGENSNCVLLYEPSDIYLQKYFIEQSNPDRQALDNKKLQAMINYCRTNQCRSHTIVQYFGELDSKPCQMCDNCDPNKAKNTVDVTTEAQMIFSCIRRVNEKVGLTFLTKILRGSKSKKITDFRYDRLSTYGLMKEQSEKRVMQICKSLVDEGYIRLEPLSEGMYPVAKLDVSAVAVLKGEEKVTLHLAEEPVPAKDNTSVDNPIFDALRQLRRKIAEEENVPPYVICNDATLREMTTYIPQDEAGMLRIKGWGESRQNRFGDAFLELLQQYKSKTTSTLAEIQKTHPKAYTPWTKEEEEELETLFQQGLDIAQIAQTLGRQNGGIRSRLEKLGLISKEYQETETEVTKT
ncbi:DNA helicase RecQ [Shimazuella sp. AN120528]|uniref:DNA helicase RecQ n=1 Tax=Shimazuella soli TaxID=1892854 RepID=UPI001F0E04E8|nr:DNA helicase RecQ [Shimazuella soli]MCH5584599.1 DNA helicase RecQ [Shimazuella soli]